MKRILCLAACAALLAVAPASAQQGIDFSKTVMQATDLGHGMIERFQLHHVGVGQFEEF